MGISEQKRRAEERERQRRERRINEAMGHLVFLAEKIEGFNRVGEHALASATLDRLDEHLNTEEGAEAGARLWRDEVATRGVTSVRVVTPKEGEE